MKLIKLFSVFLFIYLFDEINNESFPFPKKNKNLRQLSENNKYFVTKIHYSYKDNYYIQLPLGEEHIPQTLILDTTFSLISSPCNLCDNCNKKFFPFYKISNETSIIKCISQQCSPINNQSICKDEKCYFKTDKNIEGYLINSKIQINNSESLSFILPIGCVIKEGNFIKNKDANGIIGLNNDKNTIIDNMFNSNMISNNIFSICLSKKGGFLIFGQIKDDSYFNDINYINLSSSSLSSILYKLKINNIEIKQEKSLEESVSYIDSTNNYSFFTKNIYNFIFQALKKENTFDEFNYDDLYGYCKIIKEENEKDKIYELFPTIIISFDNYRFEWDPSNYIIESKIEEINFIKICLGFKELSDNNDEIILGTNFMKGNHIIFDKNNQKIAFLKSDCDKLMPTSNENKENNNIDNNNNLTEILDQEENINNSIINETILKVNENSYIFEEKTTEITEINGIEDIISDYSNKIIINQDTIINSNNYLNLSSAIINILDNTTLNNITENINYSNVYIQRSISVDKINDINMSTVTLNINDSSIENDSNIINDKIITIINNSIYDTKAKTSTINYINNTILYEFNNSIIDIINKTIYSTSINETINTLINTSIKSSNEAINTIINNSINSSIINPIRTSTIPFTQAINITTTSSVLNKIESINDSIFTSIIKSSIIINNEIISNNTISDTGNPSSDFNTKETQNVEKVDINKKIIVSDMINIDKTDDIKKDFQTDLNDHIKIEMENNNDLKEKSFMSKIFSALKGFLKYKLVYFLFALLGVAFSFIVVVLISCAIISCIKMFKRRNYMEQIDDIPRESKYNNASLSSRSN